MKKIIFFLFAAFLLHSCAVFYGPNTIKLTQQLELGMSKQDAVNILGKDYFLESSYKTDEGKMVVLHFCSYQYPDYLLYFLNDELVEFHRYEPPAPVRQEVKIIKEESE